MSRTRWLASAAVAAAVLCIPAFGQGTLTIDFEAGSGYTPGNVVGQDGWGLITGGGGTATVVAGGLGGSQCLELGDAAGNIEIEKAFADLIGTLPKLVTYKIDLRVVSGSDQYYCKPYIPGGLCGYWHTNWAQWTGAYDPNGTKWQYSYGTTGWDQYVWHTHTWNMLYSAHDGGKGQLLSYQFDNDPPEIRYPAQQCYIRDNQSSVLDRINVEFYNQGATNPDLVRLDNIVITASELPSAIPIAHAGPDLTGPPGQLYTLNATLSWDDVGIVRYRWAKGDHWDDVVYDGNDPSPSLVLPGGTYTIMLEVFDGDGLRDTDTAEYSFQYTPKPTIEVNFEPPTYTTGPVEGQDGWFFVEKDGTATVIGTDNGPGAPGTQCLELDNQGFPKGTKVKVLKGFADIVAAGGKYVTYQYDYKRVRSDIQMSKFWLPGARVGHWADNWSQWEGAKNANGSVNGGYGWRWPKNDYVWHTHKWTMVYSDHDGGKGELLSYKFDNQPEMLWYPEMASYIRSEATGLVDEVFLQLEEMWYGPATGDDTILMDNIVIKGQPLPSAFPVADAGDDVTQDPGSWNGVQLDGSRSTDDGKIVRYRWTNGWGGGVVYDGPEAKPWVDLDEGTYELVLQVYDDTGLRDTDTAKYTIGPRPAINDEVAGPWGIMNGDIYGTNASDQVPGPAGTHGGTFEVLDTAYTYNDPWTGLPAMDNFQVVFDRFGSLYWVSWNHFLESWSNNLSRKWRGSYWDGSQWKELKLGEYAVGNGALVAGVRYIYVVGGGAKDPPNTPSVYAFEKSTGHLVWQTELTGESWPQANPRPKLTLYNDKLYVIGAPLGAIFDDVQVFQVDATTGNLDWVSLITVELNWEDNDPGSFAFVPDAHGQGLHGLFWNNRSDTNSGTAGADGYADMAAVRIDPTPVTGGATVVWGPAQNIEGPYLQRSHPMYSETTGMVYTPSREDAVWPNAMYAWSPTAGLSHTYTVGLIVEHDIRQAFALDFDGRTIHAPDVYDTVRSYTDKGGGTWDHVERTFGGFSVNGWGFYGQGALVKAGNGDSILYTVTEGDTVAAPPLASKVVALNLSEPAQPGGNTPIAEWVCQVWNPGELEWDYRKPRMGPTPGPDGSVYIFQQYKDDFYYGRITRLGVAAPACPGDFNCDGVRDFDDIDPFVEALSTGQCQCPNFANCDPNGDGKINFDDIDPFIPLIGVPCP